MLHLKLTLHEKELFEKRKRKYEKLDGKFGKSKEKSVTQLKNLYSKVIIFRLNAEKKWLNRKSTLTQLFSQLYNKLNN